MNSIYNHLKFINFNFSLRTVYCIKSYKTMKLNFKLGIIIGFFAVLACKEETPEPILVKAAFTPEVSSVKEKGQVSFTDESTNNPTSRKWTFEGGDPSSSTEKSPIVTYNTPGQYQVTLTVRSRQQ